MSFFIFFFYIFVIFSNAIFILNASQKEDATDKPFVQTDVSIINSSTSQETTQPLVPNTNPDPKQEKYLYPESPSIYNSDEENDSDISFKKQKYTNDQQNSKENQPSDALQNVGQGHDESNNDYSSPSKTIPLVVQKFEKGDLLYGLDRGIRSKIIPQIDEKFGKGGTILFSTVDRYNNKFLHELYVDQKFNKEIYPSLLNKNFTNNLASNQMIQVYISTIVEGLKEKYKLEEYSEHLVEYNVFKRFCKEAIKYTLANNHKIHFLLDGIIINRAFPLDRNNKVGKDYTSAELRYIYRNKELFGNNIIFYKNGEIVEAPWNSPANQEYLKSYDIAVATRKNQSSLSNTENEMTELQNLEVANNEIQNDENINLPNPKVSKAKKRLFDQD